jgi:acyl-CoA synthetase (AMP-forming)/AMP-acid ligase II
VALLQYTSGSTGDPKGVRVTHANFIANAAETDLLWPTGSDGVVVNWLPLFHDMGMLMGVVLPLWSGIPAFLMPPDAFIRRPLRWLEAVSRFRGTHAAAPSFAYELCVRAVAEGAPTTGLDLSSWQFAANGAEPVRWSTVRDFTETFGPAGFAAHAMCPGYGLAENTLKASGSRPGDPPTLLWLSADELADNRVVALPADAAEDPRRPTVPAVGCGFPVGETRLAIVDPRTLVELPENRIGEIWVSGPCVTDGYHNRPEESDRTFRARTAAPPTSPDGRRTWLRTGDLGFLHGGELFVSGRIKDVLIRRGRNFYPQDIELSAERAHPGLRPNCAAAFSVDDGTAERLVVVVEADGRTLRSGVDRLSEAISASVRDGQRLEPDLVVVVRRGSVPKTSSGKVRRAETRRLLLSGELEPLRGAARASDVPVRIS